ncbi:MAG: Methyl viologen resistance protein YddG [candidate division BRC1 bacterium ADurb.BinA364]|nr:MAG: Methyl viologen resistance protein YddG [candidate division BRC1 bacterium ADurb.BinA364]
MASAPPPRASSKSATALGIGAVALWCWSGPCFAAGSGAMGSMPYLSASCAVGVATAMLYHKSLGRALGDLFRLPFRAAAMGFLGMSVYTVLLAYAIGMAPEKDQAQVVLVNYLWPIGIVLFGLLLLDEKPRAGLTVGGAALGFGGVLVARGAETFTAAPSSLVPHALALLGAAFWALYSVLLRRWRIPEEKSGSTLGFILCGLLAAAVASVQGDWSRAAQARALDWLWVAFLGIGPIGLAYYWWEIGIKRGAANLIAVTAYFIPIVSALLMGLFFRESLSPGLPYGAAMIAAGAWIGRLASRYPAAAKPAAE